MELVVFNQPSANASKEPQNSLQVAVNNKVQTGGAFIEANTIHASQQDIKKGYIIPIFHMDNELVISQVDFIELTTVAVHNCFPAERIISPAIRLSHSIKGRTLDAKDKPASELQE